MAKENAFLIIVRLFYHPILLWLFFMVVVSLVSVIFKTHLSCLQACEVLCHHQCLGAWPCPVVTVSTDQGHPSWMPTSRERLLYPGNWLKRPQETLDSSVASLKWWKQSVEVGRWGGRVSGASLEVHHKNEATNYCWGALTYLEHAPYWSFFLPPCPSFTATLLELLLSLGVTLKSASLLYLLIIQQFPYVQMMLVAVACGLY